SAGIARAEQEAKQLAVFWPALRSPRKRVNCAASAGIARAEQEAKQLAVFWPALRKNERRAVNCAASAGIARAEQEAKQLAVFWPALRSLGEKERARGICAFPRTGAQPVNVSKTQLFP